jgi:hypothetical protein
VGIHWDTPLNTNLNINNERQDCKVGTVCMGGTSGREEGEWRRFGWQYMADGLYIPIWNRTKKPLAIALSWGGEGGQVERWWGDVTNYNISLIGTMNPLL